MSTQLRVGGFLIHGLYTTASTSAISSSQRVRIDALAAGGTQHLVDPLAVVGDQGIGRLQIVAVERWFSSSFTLVRVASSGPDPRSRPETHQDVKSAA